MKEAHVILSGAKDPYGRDGFFGRLDGSLKNDGESRPVFRERHRFSPVARRSLWRHVKKFRYM
jgi:hypothetical protein